MARAMMEAEDEPGPEDDEGFAGSGDEVEMDGEDEGMGGEVDGSEDEDEEMESEDKDERMMMKRMFLHQDHHGKTTTFLTISSSLRRPMQARRLSSTTTPLSPLPKLLHLGSEGARSALQRTACLGTHISTLTLAHPTNARIQFTDHPHASHP